MAVAREAMTRGRLPMAAEGPRRATGEPDPLRASLKVRPECARDVEEGAMDRLRSLDIGAVIIGLLILGVGCYQEREEHSHPERKCRYSPPPLNRSLDRGCRDGEVVSELSGQGCLHGMWVEFTV